VNDALERVMRVLRLRQAALRVTTSKLERGLDAVRFSPDGRLRDMFVYHTAHTGRFSSRGMQLHNLPRGIGVDWEKLVENLTLETVDAEAARLTAAARAKNPGAPEVTADDVLASMIRLTLVPKPGHSFLIADYAQVELRCAGWMAEDAQLLADLAGDPYVLMARRLYGDPAIGKSDPRRQIGKIVVLGCGYGLSHNKLALFCQRQRVDLEATGISAEDAVRGFRNTYPGIPRLWRRLDNIARLCVERGYSAEAAKCGFDRVDGALRVTLPSGRRLWYRHARIEMLVPQYAALLWRTVSPKPTVVYEGPRGTRSLYGGKILENIDQATCSDLLRDALIRSEAEGLNPVAHVHDEVVCEVPTAEADAQRNVLVGIMEAGPSWAGGFPIKAECGVASRYVK
jgi:DNA polymerase